VKVFISWSGDQSREYAKIISEWLSSVLQSVKPYYSPKDIDKGARWAAEIGKELEECSLGIICLTPGNLSAPWIMFEAGALAKALSKTNVMPLLFDVAPTDVQGPLAQFQATSFEEDDIKKLVATINSRLEGDALDGGLMDATFAKWWPELDRKVKVVDPEPFALDEFGHRDERSIMKETLQLVRAMYYMESRFEPLDPILLRPISDLEFTPKLELKLVDLDFRYIGDLVTVDEIMLLEQADLDKKQLGQVKDILASRGLSVGMTIPEWPPQNIRLE
tara:strand:+ start:23875 stop:24705 length:831 start_codon:yes stop_codon:yes gene_type:complete